MKDVNTLLILAACLYLLLARIGWFSPAQSLTRAPALLKVERQQIPPR